jgi:hypothetical protein
VFDFNALKAAKERIGELSDFFEKAPSITPSLSPLLLLPCFFLHRFVRRYICVPEEEKKGILKFKLKQIQIKKRDKREREGRGGGVVGIDKK